MKTMDDGAAARLHSREGRPPTTGLDRLPLNARAVVSGLLPAHDAQEHSVLLRLLEIGFMPGETVRVVARGGLGGDPMAVRVGQATFALRHKEAAMVQVQRELPAGGTPPVPAAQVTGGTR